MVSPVYHHIIPRITTCTCIVWLKFCVVSLHGKIGRDVILHPYTASDALYNNSSPIPKLTKPNRKAKKNGPSHFIASSYLQSLLHLKTA
ncbi:hypothetical protein IF1G_10013 [Cordyceps javanica]|uniref:Uncharacterized protein n=1 Tax=Cordyceps javanica TaxID=43265 RepID=A0A545UPW4_9HYPO|nr:hypothetical protein IF1G_10013 [Cordyceps javanica]